MGRFTYGGPSAAFDINDELLAHVRIVVMTKLRRLEPFMLTLPHDAAGFRSLWIAPAVPLEIQVWDAKGVRVDRERLERMLQEASAADGLHLENYVVRGKAVAGA